MRAFTDTRTADAGDEVWLLEHESVFTLGLGGRPEHILDAGMIPVVRSDRGGQVTYHGPGQLVAYLLLDLKRLHMSVKDLVSRTEQSAIDTLLKLDIAGVRRAGAPGVYVDGAKVAALGFRIRNGCCYHGVAMNVDVVLEPFSRINPCGYEGMPVTSLQRLGVKLGVTEVAERWLPDIATNLGLVIERDGAQAPEPVTVIS
jgi:lipoyl(octanoyl) transferase